MNVNGLQLPERLLELAKARRWKRPADTRLLAEITGAAKPQDFTFLNLKRIAAETGGMLSLWREGHGNYYSFTTSSDPDRPTDRRLLNIERAVLIAVNWDDEAICLDYGENLDAPKVVCGTWPVDPEPCQWKIISDSFDAFVDQLGL
ncbi:MAG TPA: hypothetical protein VKQ72_04105 [Aggregatilineales bacterium]|nr:hypothetical protein [Aggregatilineales bacterium]